jgi:hypothetical protein
MSDTVPEGERGKPRQRPSHWEHPVDERRRENRARRYRRQRIVLLVVLLVVASAAAAYLYYTSDRQVERFAEGYLHKLLGTRVRMSHASFTFADGLVLERLSVGSPYPFKTPILVADRVDLKIEWLSLARLSPQVTEIVVRRPQINLQWNEREWNLQWLARHRPPEAVPPRLRPIVAIEDGFLRVQRLGSLPGAEPEGKVTEMQVSGILLPSESDPDTLRFQTNVTSQEVNLAVASGWLDLRTGALKFEGQASNVALTPALYSSLPRDVQAIWHKLEPTGSINLKATFDDAQGFGLAMDMTGVNFSYKYKDMLHQFENLTGRCRFLPAGLELTGVQGLLNGCPIRLEGTVTGFESTQFAVDLQLWADHVDFVKSRPLLVSLAPHMEGIYVYYAPEGYVDVELKIHRGKQEKAPLDVSGKVFCRDVKMRYLLFPYSLERIRGTMEFGGNRFETAGLTGYHGPAEITLEGWGENLGPLVESRVKVHARNVPLDADLRQAMAKAQRDTYDQFSPGGVADMEGDIYRPPREGAMPQVTVDLDLRDCVFKYRWFPYELTHTTGRVVIAPDRTDIINVQGRHGNAAITLSGQVFGVDKPNPSVQLKVAGRDVAIDEDLEQALPQRERDILRVFHLSGLADIDGTVTQGPETKGRLEYDLALRLSGARMIYEGFPFLAEQLTGDLHLARGSCRIESLSGFNSGARIEARGTIEQTENDFAMDLTLTGKDVPLNESLRGALGPEMRSAWSHLAPRGRVDLSAHLIKAFGAKEIVKHHVWVTARDLQARLDFFPYPLEHVNGQMEFQASEVRLHDLRARTGPTEFLLTGRIAYSDAGPEIDLAIRATGLRFEGPLREAVPGALQRAFALIRPTGRVDLNLEHLLYHQTPSGKAEATWYGSAVLDEVGIEPGLKVSGLVGTAEMQGRWTEGQVSLDGRLWVQQGKIADKQISNMRLLIDKPANASTVSIKNVEGEFYGGRLEGFATIGLGEGGKYAFSLAAEDVDFERLLREGFGLEHNIAGGRMRGTLGLWAKAADSATAEGSGYAYVTDARLYELPLVARLFNFFQLEPADRIAFQKARVLYFVRGKRLVLGDIRLEGRAMNLYGSGTMGADGKLDLTFMVGKKNDDPLIPALSELMEGIRKQVVVVIVSGTLAEPKVQTRTLSAITAPFREVIGMVQEQRARERQATGK